MDFLAVKLSPVDLPGRVSPQFRPGSTCTAHSKQTVPSVMKLCGATCLHWVREVRAAMIFLNKTIFFTRTAHAGQKSIYCYVFKPMW